MAVLPDPVASNSLTAFIQYTEPRQCRESSTYNHSFSNGSNLTTALRKDLQPVLALTTVAASPRELRSTYLKVVKVEKTQHRLLSVELQSNVWNLTRPTSKGWCWSPRCNNTRILRVPEWPKLATTYDSSKQQHCGAPET